MDIQTY